MQKHNYNNTCKTYGEARSLSSWSLFNNSLTSTKKIFIYKWKYIMERWVTVPHKMLERLHERCQHRYSTGRFVISLYCSKRYDSNQSTYHWRLHWIPLEEHGLESSSQSSPITEIQLGEWHGVYLMLSSTICLIVDSLQVSSGSPGCGARPRHNLYTGSWKICYTRKSYYRYKDWFLMVIL